MNRLLNIRYSPPVLHHLENDFKSNIDSTISADNDLTTAASNNRIIPLMCKLFQSMTFNKVIPINDF
jgi:hypothetical protein